MSAVGAASPDVVSRLHRSAALLGLDDRVLVLQQGAGWSARLGRAGLFAATRGRQIAVAPAVASLPRRLGDLVLAHECVHVLQQTEGAVWDRRGDSEADLEAEARRVARALVDGGSLPRRSRDADRLHPRWQGHDSFEHRLLGDTPTGLLTVPGVISPSSPSATVVGDMLLIA